MVRCKFSLSLLIARVLSLFLVLVSLSACRAQTPKVDGQKYTIHTVVDQMQGMPFVALMAPEGWQVSGQVNWKYADVSNPVNAFVLIANPAKPEAVTFFNRAACFWLQGAAAYNRPGLRTLGQINLQPMSPEDAIRSAVTKLYRANQPGLQLVGVRQMPGLAAALQADPNQFKGIGLKVQYTENETPIEEEFYALYYYVPIPYDGPQGHSVQLDWGLDQVHSFKAPVGTLATHRDTFAFVVHSVKVNPAWKQRAASIREFLNDQFNRNLAQGYASIEAAGRLSKQISANNDAMIASLDSQRATANAASANSGASSRSSNDNFDDYVRGVDTTNDPYTGTSQHSSNEQYHWTDGYGNYANSNDPNFDPNQNSNISWQQMTPAR